MKTMDELFAEDEAKRLAKAREEIAAEDAAWAALPEEEKLRIIAERDAVWERLENLAEADEDETDEDEENEE